MDGLFRKISQNTFGAWKPNARLESPDWFNNVGYSANLKELAPYNLLTFEQWAEKQNWAAYLN